MKDNLDLTSELLIELGFHYEKWQQPGQSAGLDLYHGYDYYFKKIGNKTDLVLRKRLDKIKVEGFYCSNIKTVCQLNNLIDLLK